LAGIEAFLNFAPQNSHNMKAIFTSMLLMIFVGVQAMPVYTDSTNPGKKSEISTPSNPSTVSMQQLQEENNQLRARLAALENKFEDERGLFNFKMTMVNMVSQLDNNKKVETLEDLKSHLGFNQMMANTLLLLKGETAK
jgi:TolA-binding protein